ncbi:unnamed protein product, partial [marine sediment metagenome]
SDFNIINRISKNKLLIKSIGYKKMINLSLKQASGVSSIALIAVPISLIGLIIYSEGLFRNLAILLTSGFIVITFSSIFLLILFELEIYPIDAQVV